MINYPDTYELVLQEELPDIHSAGYLFRHKKSGARVAVVLNDDENKVFHIAFRTTPVNSKGTPHIHGAQRSLRQPEISVQGSLCGTGQRVPEHVSERHDLF